MEYSDEENERLFLEQDKYMDARAEELLDHDPELVKLYHRSKKWKLSAKALQGQLIELIESKQIAIQLQNYIGNHKNVSERMREVLPDAFIREGIASDCADAMDAAAEHLRLLATEIRKQISELPTLNIRDAAQWETVEKAGLKAMMESFRKYRD